MRVLRLPALLVVIAIGSIVDASAGWRWVGLSVGETSGFVYRQRTEIGAVEGGVGWSIIGQGAIQVHFASEIEFYDAHSVQLYAGFGARVKFEDDTLYGLRFPLGFNYQFHSEHHQWQAFLEASPLLDVYPDISGHVSVVGGIRVSS